MNFLSFVLMVCVDFVTENPASCKQHLCTTSSIGNYDEPAKKER